MENHHGPFIEIDGDYRTENSMVDLSMANCECHKQMVYIYIYIYTRNAWVLPRRCSVDVSHSQTNDVANYRNSYGENNKGTRDY